jgi:transcriptional regulator with XRE-family HTH domain
MLASRDLHVLGQRVGELRRAAGLTQRKLAAAAGVSHAYIALLEHGRLASPGTFRLDAVARALGLPSADALLHAPRGHGPAFDHAMSLLPVYPWGAAEDPRSPDQPPDPDHLEPPPLGRETLVGPNGFGLLIRGDTLQPRGLAAGDVAWINPDRPLRLGKLVASLEPQVGLVLTTFQLGQAAVGPVVGITAWRLPR